MGDLFAIIGFNTLIQIFGKFFTTILGFISVGLLTRYLGQEGFGNFSLIFVYWSFFGIIADFGLQLTMVRELAKKKNLSSKIYGTYFWLKLFLVLLSTILAYVCLLFFPYSKFLKIAIMIAAFGTGIGVLNSYGTVIFQANLRMDLVTAVDVLVKTITTLLVVLFIYFKAGLFSLINTVLLGNLAGLILILFLLKRLKVINFSFDGNLAWKIIYKSVPVGFTSLLALSYFKVDSILLSILKGAREVGIYSLSYKVIENLLMFWGFYMATVYPLLSRFAKEKKSSSNLWQKSTFLAVFSGILIIVGGWIFAPLLIRILGGKEFSESIMPFRILLFAVPFFFLNNLYYHSFLVEEKIKEIIFLLLIVLCLNVVLNIIFIPKYSFFSTSLNTLITEFSLFCLYWIFINKLKKNE